MTIDTVTVPPAGGTLDDPENYFVLQQAWQEALTGTTLPELNTSITQLNAHLATIVLEQLPDMTGNAGRAVIVNAAEDAAVFSAPIHTLAGHRNKVINGEGRINQREAAGNIQDGEYAHDRHFALTQSNEISVSTVSNAAAGVRSMMRLSQANASAQRMGYAQIIESGETYALRGKTVTLGGKLRYSNAAAVRYAVIEWTGTADSTVKDVVNDWTSGTYTGGNFFVSSNFNVLAVGSKTPAAATVEDWSLTATVGASANNIVVFIWTEGTAAQNSTLDLRWGLVEGDATNEVDFGAWRDDVIEYLLCVPLHYRTTKQSSGHGRIYATASATLLKMAHGTFPAPMRTTPSTSIVTLPTSEGMASVQLYVAGNLDWVLQGTKNGTTGLCRAYDGVYSFDAEIGT